MSVIFEEKDSIFFVGGRGTKTGDANAGGCTQDFWDSSQTLSDVMRANGEPKSENAAWNDEQTACTVTNNGSNKVRITESGESSFLACSVGLVVYVKFSSEYEDGRYEVIAVDPSGNWIDIDLAYDTDDETCDCKAGGAFDTLQRAADNTDAGNGYNVKIYTNKAEALTAAIDFDTTDGSIANNSHKIVEGFHTQPGDMNYGETYYQGPLDALINGIDTDKCVTLDADGGAYDVITINNFDGLVLKNIYFYNTDKESGHDCIVASNSPANISLINCKFDTAYGAIAGVLNNGFEMRGCYVGNDFGYTYQFNTFYARGGHITNCVFDADGLYYTYIKDSAIFEYCLFWKSVRGVYIYNSQTFNNCIFYGQTECCFYPSNAADASIRGRNNIFMPAEAADFVVYRPTALGSVCDEALRASCIWTIAGGKVINHLSINGKLRQLSDVIEEDPQFVDVANGDFRPRNPAVLRGGKPDISGNPTQMGAILQKYQFGDRERIANMARLRIIR